MPTFIMLTRLNPDAVRSPRGLEQLERDAMKRVREECADVEWLSSYAVLGPCDYLDVFMANDIETPPVYRRSFVRLATPILKSGHQRSGIVSRSSSGRCRGRADRGHTLRRFSTASDAGGHSHRHP